MPSPAPDARTCPVCGTPFTPRFPWHVYDRPRCKSVAYWQRRVDRAREPDEGTERKEAM